jgi:hypothetical protein
MLPSQAAAKFLTGGMLSSKAASQMPPPPGGRLPPLRKLAFFRRKASMRAAISSADNPARPVNRSELNSSASQSSFSFQ